MTKFVKYGKGKYMGVGKVKDVFPKKKSLGYLVAYRTTGAEKFEMKSNYGYTWDSHSSKTAIEDLAKYLVSKGNADVVVCKIIKEVKNEKST